MITGPTFGSAYNMIKCIDYEQAKKLMAQMKASLKNVDIVQGSKANEVMIGKLQNAHETGKALQCLRNSLSLGTRNTSTGEIINSYKSHSKNMPKSKIDIRL